MFCRRNLGVHVNLMSRKTEEDLIDSSARQCILYYSNPNFSLDAESMSLQMPSDDKIEEDDDDDDDDEDEDDEDEIEKEEESNSGDNDCDENCRHHPNGCHRHHRQLDINEELERTEFESQIDLDTECYVDCYEHDACQRANVLSMYRHQRPSQHRLIGKGHVRWFLSSAVQSCRICCHSKPCLFLTYVILILVLLSSFVSLVLVSVLVVEPYYRVVNFANVTCRAYEVNFGNQEQSCSCGKGCSSKYLCIKIQVEYFDAKVEPILATLYEDEASLNRQVSRIIYILTSMCFCLCTYNHLHGSKIMKGKIGRFRFFPGIVRLLLLHAWEFPVVICMPPEVYYNTFRNKPITLSVGQYTGFKHAPL